MNYIAIVLSYPAPNCPEVFLIPEKDVTDALHESLAEQVGGFPWWCTPPDDDFERLERGEEFLYDLKKAIPFAMSPHDKEDNPVTISRWYGFVVQ